MRGDWSDMSGSGGADAVRRRTGTVLRRGLPVAVAAVALTACGGSGGLDTSAKGPAGTTAGPTSSSSAPTTSSAPPATAATASAADAVRADLLADFRHYSSGYVRALNTRNGNTPELVKYSTAQMQAVVDGRVRTMRQLDLRLKGTPRLWYGRSDIEGNRAYLRVCEFDSAARFVYRSSGKTAKAVKDEWHAYSVRFLKRDGRWHVNQYDAAKFSCREAT